MIEHDDALHAGREAAAPEVAPTPPAAAPPSGAAAARRPEKHVSLQTVERLSVYRRVLEELDDPIMERALVAETYSRSPR